jgi:hypothetical protein
MDRPRTTLYADITKSGNIYFCSRDNSNCFVALYDAFSSHIDPAKVNLNTGVDFLARSDTISVNEDNLDVSQAHVIEKLMFYDQGSTQPTSSYTANDYNPGGYYESRWWPTAIELIGAGVLILASVIFFFFMRHKSRKGV